MQKYIMRTSGNNLLNHRLWRKMWWNKIANLVQEGKVKSLDFRKCPLQKK